MSELCDILSGLPKDTVCILSTRNLCDVINEATLNRINSTKITLIAQNSIDCKKAYMKKVLKILNADDENSNHTAGLSRIITVKIGARVMIRCNIDVTIGFVNGSIATIVSVSRAIDSDDIDSIKIALAIGNEHTIERITVTFEVISGAYIIRKQFALCLSYAVTVHKSQGLSLKNAVIDAGNSIFTTGQIYVALSRLTSLKGLYLINYDPFSVKANETSIIEYNRSRGLYDLSTINVPSRRGQKIADRRWTVLREVAQYQQNTK